MHRSRGDTVSPAHCVLLLAAVNFVGLCTAGPVGPLPNITSSDVGLKEGSCAVGDVVYMPGDEFPGSSACERCACAGGAVHCSKQRCEPRPGCKALHRPDHCCPTYQCECEQEGRVYGNGEKLVDPADPCRVCYCQGGEVVCRRIACFVRDDCLPRLVPGRCCPEYDNCPLRGVTTIPGVAPSISSIMNIEDVGASVGSSAPKENIKQEITIKEITPVSEIPVITDVKIKEVLPSSSMEVAEYASSKSPLIPREATSDKPVSEQIDVYSEKTEPAAVNEMKSSSPPILVSSLAPEAPTKPIESFIDVKNTYDSQPSKISLSTQDSISSDIYSSNLPSIATIGSSSATPDNAHVASTTKAPMIEEEDSSLFDHNPAFPPLPDDLSVLSNHDDEIVPENMENEHVSSGQEVNVATSAPSTEATVKEILTTTPKALELTSTTEKILETSADLTTAKIYTTVTTELPIKKENPMLNLRSAIPTEILNVPSAVPEDITGELDDITETTTTANEFASISTSTTTENYIKLEEKYTEKSELPAEDKTPSSSLAPRVTELDTTTHKVTDTTEPPSSSQVSQEQTTSSIAKSNIATEVTSQTELSSLPIETSDQNPHETSDIIAKEKTLTSTSNPVAMEVTTKISSTLPEIIKISTAEPSNADNFSFENIETTEFVLTSFGSGESATDTIELIKITADSDKNAAIIEPNAKKNSVLTDLINLVGDVASISDHTEGPGHITGPTGISDSEELIPVNAGYKSKNNNWNPNSITERPPKNKSQTNKQKIIEIEDDDSDNITDSPPPNDKVEPTTRRPIIDNVSDVMPENKTEKKDIEIITQSYVPTINRRPTKVVMKKTNERQASEEATTGGAAASVSSEASVQSSSETATTSDASSESVERVTGETSTAAQ